MASGVKRLAVNLHAGRRQFGSSERPAPAIRLTALAWASRDGSILAVPASRRFWSIDVSGRTGKEIHENTR
jgi:hypothetical protein